MIEATPPQNESIEQCALGCILVENSSIDTIRQFVLPHHFYHHRNQLLFQVMSAMYDSRPFGIDAETVRDELERQNRLSEIGGWQYLIKLLETVPDASHAEHYARRIRGWSDLRSVLRVADQIQRSVSSGSEIGEVLAEAEEALFAIAGAGETSGSVHISDALNDTMRVILERVDAPDGMAGISTGFTGIDNLIGGLQRGRFLVLAARTGCGKTALMCNIALHVARAARLRWEKRNDVQSKLEGGVLIVSLEMLRTELGERLLSMRSRIDAGRLSRGRLDELEQHAVFAGCQFLGGLPIQIDDSPGRTMMKIEAICRREIRQHKYGLIVIDHIGIVDADPGQRFKAEQHVADVSRRMKKLAQSLDVPVLGLCQMNRDFEKREDKRPRLSDLRQSGAIEQDADVVMFINRPEIYDSTNRPGEADVIVAKNRSGKLGVAELVWRASTLLFLDKATAWDEPDSQVTPEAIHER